MNRRTDGWMGWYRLGGIMNIVIDGGISHRGAVGMTTND